MRYAAVSTTGWLLLVDLKDGKVQPLEYCKPEYYGISWFPESTDLVLSHSGLNNADLVDIATYANSEKGWLTNGVKSSGTFLSQPHQIICAPDGRVVCTNTGRNVITVFNFEQPNIFQEAGISAARWDRISLDQITGDHLNSVFIRDNLLYVIAHGHTKGSKLATFTYPQMELLSVEQLGPITSLHNIWITKEGQRISCHSDCGSLIDLDEKAPLWESGASVYTRGLAAAENYVLIGESQKTGRELRRISLSGLWMLDKKTWQPIDYITLGPFGAVNEVRILDAADEAHHGYPFKGIESLLTKDVRLDVSRSRLAASIASAQARLFWAGWEPVFGSAEILPDGTRRSGRDQLCLMIRQSQEDPTLVFTYALEAQAGAHVSAVFGYQGEGDRNMVALLLQPSGGSAVLSAWQHGGDNWRILPNLHVPNLPIAGTMQLVTTQQHVTLLIDNQKIATLNSQELGIQRCNRGLGIRWTGASVKPIIAKA